MLSKFASSAPFYVTTSFVNPSERIAIERPSERPTFFVNPSERIAIEVDPSETIAQLKLTLEAQGLGNHRDMVLSIELEDDRTLSHYNTQQKSKFLLSFRKRFQIRFKVQSIMTVNLVVEACDTIDMLREKAVVATSIPSLFLQDILFAGQRLADLETLKFYKIEEDDTVIVKLSAGDRLSVLDELMWLEVEETLESL